MVCCLAVAGFAMAQTTITSGTVYTTGTSFSVPSGYKVVKVEVWGGGGGGERNSTQCGDGGGGGGYACINLDGSLVGPVTLNVTIGSGGSAASGENALGCPGGTTTVSYGGTTMVEATGGRGGGHTGTYSCGGDASYYGRAGGTGSVNTSFPGFLSQVTNNGGSGGSGKSWGLGDLALRAGGGGGAAGSASGVGASGNDGHADGLNGTGGDGGTGTNGAGSGGAGGDNGFSGHDGGNGTAPGGGGGGCPNKKLATNAHPGSGAVGGVRFTLQPACDATPGEISVGILVCTPDTTCLISSTTDATSSTSGSYLWQSSPDHSTWTTIDGVGNVKQYTATATGYYRRGYAVSGCTTVYTDYVYVARPSDINPGTIKDGDNQTEKAICAGASDVNIILSKNYSGNVQWQTSSDNVNWTNAYTAATYSITSAPEATTYVRYLVKINETCDVPSNNVYKLTVKPLPVVKINDANPYLVSKCADASIDVSVTGADSYEWQNGSTANPATFGPSTAADSYVVTGTTNGCSSTATVTFTILPVPTISATNATQNITYGASIADVVISNTNSVVELSTLPSWMSYNTSTQTLSGKPTAQGTYTVTATATSNTTPACGTATQEIKITVGKKNLTVTYTGTDGDNTKVYDGYPLTLSYDKLTFTGLESTDHITSGVITTDGYKVGDYICNAGSFERMWATGTATPSGFGPTSVTQNYNVTFNVTLSITKRPLEITANSASKEYDATPLTDDGWTYTNGTSLASTDEATVIVTGSQLCPGSSPNVVGAVSIKHTSDNEDVTDCYTITKKNGTLTVTPMACPATKTFEGYDYPLVQVGNKCWFAENLRAAATDAVPYDNQSANTAKFGLLYNWSAALAGNGAIKTILVTANSCRVSVRQAGPFLLLLTSTSCRPSRLV